MSVINLSDAISAASAAEASGTSTVEAIAKTALQPAVDAGVEAVKNTAIVMVENEIKTLFGANNLEMELAELLLSNITAKLQAFHIKL